MTNEHTVAHRKVEGARWRRRLLWALLAALVVGGFAYAVWPKPIDVELATATRRTLTVTLDADGYTRVKQRFSVSAPVTANVLRMQLQVGDEVRAGGVVARLLPLSAPLLDERARSQAAALVAVAIASNQQASSQVERARVALEQSRIDAERTRGLLARGGVARAELERAELDERACNAEFRAAEFAAKVATHQLEQANAALGRYGKSMPIDVVTVMSPIDGRVLSVIQVNEGVVQVGAPLVEIGDPKALEIVTEVLTQDAVAVKPKARSEVSDWGGAAVAAEIRLVEPSGFTRRSALGVEEQRVNVILDLTSPYERWEKLGDGYRVTVHVETQRVEDVITVPQSALFRSGAAWAVYLVRQGRAQLQTLEVGTRDKSLAHITKGLIEGDVVIVHPNSKVVDGARVAER